MSYIKFEGIHKKFGENHVLKGIDLEIEKGQLVTLLGPSGCGKSTLLRCLAGLEEVTSGQIYLDGENITQKSPRERGIGMVFQQYSLFPNMTVAQNVAFGMKMKKLPKDDIARKTEEILRIVDLADKAGQYPAQLSGGQQQRVALARAIVTEPKVLLLDEPLSAIDALLRHALQTEIRRIQQEFGITTIFVTHDQDEAMVMSDTIHLFHEGHVVQSGTPIEMYTRPRSRFAASFIGHYNIVAAADFSKACGAPLSCQDMVIRPEVIAMRAGDPEDGQDCYLLRGEITASLSHGNIIRYTVACGHGVALDVDIMFDPSLLFSVGEKVTLAVKRENCIEL